MLIFRENKNFKYHQRRSHLDNIFRLYLDYIYFTFISKFILQVSENSFSILTFGYLGLSLTSQ